MGISLSAALKGAARDIDALDARVLLRALLRVDDVYLIAHAERTLTPAEQRQYQLLVARRVAGEPVAYIVGEREFYGHRFAVSPAVLIPRPDTELLVELALARLPREAPGMVLDLGTGSGCIAVSIALERPAARLIATDRSAAALAVAGANARDLGAGNVAFHGGDWYAALPPDRAAAFDLIVSNPPYVAEGDAHLEQGDLRFEPVDALAAPAGGFACLEAIIAGAPARLKPGAWLLLEHGYDQAQGCRERLQAAGFADVQSWRDLAGIERVSGGRQLP